MSIRTQLRKARVLFMKAPTQCVVYGSSIPVTCYVVVHLLDAPFTYNVLESHFFSQAGVLSIEPRAFVSYAVVQMRSVWVYALVWHFVVYVSALRDIIRTNQMHIGVLGVPEFLLSGFSSVTLMAEYRSTSFRSSKILRSTVLPDNVGSGWEAAKYQYNFARRGQGSVLLGGVLIDLKFLICLLFLLAAIWAVHEMWSHYWDWKQRHWHWAVLPPTPVPYSAGILWPTVSVCVQWPTDYYCIRDARHRGPLVPKMVERKPYIHRCPFKSRLIWWKPNQSARVIASLSARHSRYLQKEIHLRLTRRHINPYRCIQHRLKCLHWRSDDVEANVAFINAVLMSDPYVYLSMMLGCDRLTKLAYYQSVWRSRQILLLPEVVVSSLNPYTSGLKLLRRVHPSELSWSELVQCG
ncbi:hypothetical protein PHYSODRAFT_327570 [Phytophthora sojae]|uniref:Uncharacterized protein n=1 Tax=Phytophthora sojae (strain P6497) TaxID=1094619 RepID=G4Z2D1_PHYSP|nr:hypothetical protein PHYSODRAFT_327570 [Phytophthora sojae]EGZ19275.1 hypothetical protein PHYSODRAFT_327570 [Phytophthora sojae]|eukprot:XP_009521992.1 hypothetical protein PHYSODRAFT_327570 [Phytophthora sojae]